MAKIKTQTIPSVDEDSRYYWRKYKLVNRQMEIETPMRYYHSPIKMVKTKKTDNTTLKANTDFHTLLVGVSIGTTI